MQYITVIILTTLLDLCIVEWQKKIHKEWIVIVMQDVVLVIEPYQLEPYQDCGFEC